MNISKALAVAARNLTVPPSLPDAEKLAFRPRAAKRTAPPARTDVRALRQTNLTTLAKVRALLTRTIAMLG